MNVEMYLNELFSDLYFYYLLCEGIKEDDVEGIFLTEDGEEIEGRAFIEYFKDEFDEVLIDEVYSVINDDEEVDDISRYEIINFLASKYYIYNYDNKEIIDILNKLDTNELINLFDKNYDMAIDMINSYLFLEADIELEMDLRRKIYDSKDKETLLRYEWNAGMIVIRTINDILRDVVYNLYNNFIQYGYDDIDALNCTWEYFLHNFDPIGELNSLGFDEEQIYYLKKMLLSLIYADLYEDICNGSIIQSDDYDENLKNVVVVVSVLLGLISIPTEDVRNRMLKHFILLHDEKDKFKNNRISTYKTGQIKVLKKVNPLFELDELTFK